MSVRYYGFRQSEYSSNMVDDAIICLKAERKCSGCEYNHPVLGCQAGKKDNEIKEADMKKSAMEKMVDIIVERRKKCFNDFHFNVERALIQMENEARRLLAEEQAQKPTAPAGLVEEAVNRFLSWELPEDFTPDGGVSFSRIEGCEPTGTNLLTASQAEEMFKHCLQAGPNDTRCDACEVLGRFVNSPAPSSDEVAREYAEFDISLGIKSVQELSNKGWELVCFATPSVGIFKHHPAPAKSAGRCPYIVTEYACGNYQSKVCPEGHDPEKCGAKVYYPPKDRCEGDEYRHATRQIEHDAAHRSPAEFEKEPKI